MKKIFRLLMVAMGVIVMNSCSSDYLNSFNYNVMLRPSENVLAAPR